MARKKITEIAGDYTWICTYTMHNPRDIPKGRLEKTKQSSAARKALNDKSSRRKLEGILCANFRGGDLFVTLTYDDNNLPKDRTAAIKKFKFFIKKVRDQRKRRKERCDYVYCTENKHNRGRLHHHVVINMASKTAVTELHALWTHGLIEIEYINEDDMSFADIALYMCKEQNSIYGKKCWIPSEKLKRPIVEREIIPDNSAIIPPHNCIILESIEIQNEFGRFTYMKYREIAPHVSRFTRQPKNKGQHRLLA